MARKSSFIDDLSNAPWWVSLFLGLAAYGIANYVLPNLEIVNPLLQPLLQVVLPLMSPYVLGLFALVSVFAFGNGYRKRRMYETRKDIASLRSLSWEQFEELVGEHFRRHGYTVAENASGGADGGVDLKLKRDGKTTLVQCKHWRSNKVGVVVLRELLGVVVADGATEGIVVCSGEFTADAMRFSERTDIELIDGNALLAISKVAATRPTTIKRDVEGSSEWPKCEQCGQPMVVRKATKGRNVGNRFLGCSGFPSCRATMEL